MINHSRIGTAVTVLLLCAGIVSIGSMTGCTTLWFAWLAAGLDKGEKVEAEYVIPKGKRVLVIVESPSHVTSRELLHRGIAIGVTSRLLANDLVDDVVDYADFVALSQATSRFEGLTTAEIGQRLGADLVIYVFLERFSLKDNPSDVIWHGRCEGWVKVIDASPGVTIDNARLWPLDRLAGGFPAAAPDRDDVVNSSRQYGDRLTRALTDAMAESIVNLFQSHYRTGLDRRDSSPTGELDTPLL